MDKNASYPPAGDDLKQEDVLREDAEPRSTQYLNNMIDKEEGISSPNFVFATEPHGKTTALELERNIGDVSIGAGVVIGQIQRD